MDVSANDLAPIRELYAQGRYRQALDSAAPFGPLREWTGPAARLLAGRLAIQLGAPKLGRRLHLVAFRESPVYPEAIYYHARYRMEQFGPLSAWRFMREHFDWSDAPPDLRADWLALAAFVAGRLRDFDRADKFLIQAESASPNRAWVAVERSSVLETAERSEEAMTSARRSLELHPWFRPGVQAVAHLLTRRGRDRDAAEFLTEAVEHLESGIVLAQLAAIQLDLGRPVDARKNLDRYAELTPLIEKDVAKWLSARRADVAYLLGETAAAADHARAVGEEFYTKFAEQLIGEPGALATGLTYPVANAPGSPRRLLLPVDLSYETAAPSPAELLTRFWKQPLPHILDAGPALDGLPDAAERRRFAAAGWHTREFALTLDAAVALIERGVPFFITLVEAGYGQSRLVIGADPIRGSVFLADGLDRKPAEAPVSVLLERYKVFGPRCLIAVPVDAAAKLDGLALPDAVLYEQLFHMQCDLLDARFAPAKEKLARLCAEYPGHRIARQADLAWARATLHPVLLLDAMNALLADAPHDATLLLTKAAAQRELGQVPERLALLLAEGSKIDAEPLLMQSLAQMLLADPDCQLEAQRLLRRSVRQRPHAAAGYYLLATQYWEGQHFSEAAELYRMAACLDDREEQFADAYAKVARSLDQVPEALRLFQQKATRATVPSPSATRALFQTLWDRDEPEQAFAALGKAVEKLEARPDNVATKPALADLRLYRAEMFANFGRFADAEAELTATKSLAPPVAWCKASARVARAKPDYTAALAYVRELLTHDPLNIEGRRIATALISDTQGLAAARSYVRDAAQQFPHVYPLAKLRAELLYREPDDDAIQATRDLLDLCPHDAWAYRQLALVLAERRRHDEALAAAHAAGKIEPEHPSQYAILGHVHRRADRVEDALEAFRAGVRATVDHDLCINELVQYSRGLKEKKAALRFIAEQLHDQPHSGEGLLAYFEQAGRLIDDPEEQERFLSELERFLDERPDLWQCWSLTAQQLATMQRTDEAVSLAKEAAARFPLSARLWADLAEACRLANRSEERLDALRQANAAMPGWPPVAKELADALAEADEEDEALAILTRAVQRNPLDHFAHWMLAERLWNAGESRRALDEAKQSVRHEPGYDSHQDPRPDLAWGAVMVWSDRLDADNEAVELARELTRDRSGDPRAWLRLARCLHDPAFADEALAALEKAVALDPRNVEAYDLKAEKLTQIGRFDEALEAARPAALSADLPLVLQGRAAWIEARRGNYASAIPPMQALVAVDPEYVWGWQQLAEWYNETGRPQSYLEAASELARLKPEHPMPLTMRGEAKIQTGDREGGKADLKDVLRNYPGYSPAAVVLFDACLADGEHREARSALAVLQEYLVGPEVLVKQLQYAARTEDADGAARAFSEICQHPGEGTPLFLQMAMSEMRAADLDEKSQELLKEAWQSGEPFNPWAAVYWLDTDAGEETTPEERLTALDAALKYYPTFIPGHDRRSEQLAAVGRFDEAAAACAPPGVGPPLPVALRGRAAWIESQRGDRDKAIALMKAVVADEPDYTWGWRQLTHWYDAAGLHRDCLEAADQLVRLNPDDALAHGIRGEARRAIGDTRGAKDDFQKAFNLDPSFDAAGLQLVTAQLATDDLNGASRTLNTLREHADGPLIKLRAVQIAARQGDLAAARQSFQALGKDVSATRSILRDAIAAMAEAGWEAEADDDLEELIGDPAATQPTAGLWAERLIHAGEGDAVADRLGELTERNPPVGREAICTYAWGQAVAGQSDAVSNTIQQYAELLGQDDDSWARAGLAAVEAGQYGFAAAWLGDWPKRDGVRPWMLSPLADAYRALNRDADAEKLTRDVAERFPPESLPAEFRAWLALTAAVAGRTAEASEHLRAVDPFGQPDGTKLVLAMVEAVVSVQETAPFNRATAFAEAKENLRVAIGACDSKDVPPGAARWWRRCADRIASDVGTLKARLWAWGQWVSPWVRE